MNNGEKLGHLIRKIRMRANGFSTHELKVNSEDMLRILNAADLGLVLNVEGNEEVVKLKKEFQQLEKDYLSIQSDRGILRSTYVADKARIRLLGFKDVDAILRFVEGVRSYREHRIAAVPDLPAAPYVAPLIGAALVEAALVEAAYVAPLLEAALVEAALVEAALVEAAKAGTPCAEYSVKDFLGEIVSKAQPPEAELNSPEPKSPDLPF